MIVLFRKATGVDDLSDNRMEELLKMQSQEQQQAQEQENSQEYLQQDYEQNFDFSVLSEELSEPDQIDQEVFFETQDEIAPNLPELDPTKPIFKTDKTCEHLLIAPNKTFHPIPLLSFPGAGNTWTRHLIQKATGIYTGSVYTDGGLYKGGYKGEMENPISGTTIAQKVHRTTSNQDSKSLFEHSPKYCIFLMRDPRKAMMSEFNRLESHGHTASAGMEVFFSENWSKRLDMWLGKSKGISFFQTYASPFINHWCSEEIFYIYFEDLKSSQDNLILIMRNLVKFINKVNLEAGLSQVEFLEDCLLSNLDGKYFRAKKNQYNLDEIFSQEIMARMMKMLGELDEIMGGVFPPGYGDKDEPV